MLKHVIPGYSRLRGRRNRLFLERLREEGYENTSEYRRFSGRTLNKADELRIETVAMDLNGTSTIDGELLEGLVSRLTRLHEQHEVVIKILTGDVRGTAAEVQKILMDASVPVDLLVCKDHRGTAFAKLTCLANEMNPGTTAYFGNGQGDYLAVRAADYSVALTQKELSSTDTLFGAVGHANSMVDALDALLSEQVMKASFHQ